MIMKKENKNKSELSDRHIAWIVYHKMGMKVKPSKKVYNRASFKKQKED